MNREKLTKLWLNIESSKKSSLVIYLWLDLWNDQTSQVFLKVASCVQIAIQVVREPSCYLH